MLKARTVQSEEIRLHLRDAHDRVMSVATVQQQLQASGHGGPIELGPYLSRLCDALAASMIGDSRPIALKVEADPGTGVSAEAVSIGLDYYRTRDQCTEARFPERRRVDRREIRSRRSHWHLSVSDNGVGLQQDGRPPRHAGLGTTIVEALAHQLKACVETTHRSPGMSVSIVHAAYSGATPRQCKRRSDYVARTDHYHRRLFLFGGFSGRFGGYGYGYRHGGVGIIGMVSISLSFLCWSGGLDVRPAVPKRT